MVLFAPSLLATSDDPGIVSHLLREEAAAFVFIGLMFLQAWRHFDRRRIFHTAFVVFTGLFAAVHWIGLFGDDPVWWPSVVNTVPFALMLITIPRGAEKQ
ncbi:MAG TPA: hypothetical protein VN700_20600 [Vicinamibacterales bacterium]|nr:hypothetical protein [Vicinamibacterales bacterium]